MWDPPGPALEPVSAALAGGFLTTAPPGKSLPASRLKAVFVFHFLQKAASDFLQAGINVLSLCAHLCYVSLPPSPPQLEASSGQGFFLPFCIFIMFPA